MVTIAARTEAILDMARRELERRPWLEHEHHLATVVLMIRFDRYGEPKRCVVKTDSEEPL